MKPLRVLVACEESGAVRDKLRERGVDAVSCDLKPSKTPGPHYQGDVFDLIEPGRWDMLIGFPPCTHLAVSGARWFAGKQASGEQAEALEFFRRLWTAPVPRIALENPKGIVSTRLRPPDQIIQPWMFGHGETKETHLWLKNLPALRPTNVVAGREQRIWKMGPSPERAEMRSKTYPGVAEAMADQWTRPYPVQAVLW